MDSDSTEATFTVKSAMLAWLRDMAARYELGDEHKALRIVLVHAMEEVDRETLFTDVRCHYCE